MSCFRPEEWQFEASLRLQALLTRQTLRRLVGDFERLLRADRRAETGEDRPSNLTELADALLIAHDIDLLGQSDVRAALTRALQTGDIENPERWVSGGPMARRFTESVGLPSALAGVRSPERPSAVSRVSPPVAHRPLEPYQDDVSGEMYERMKNAASPENRAIVSLPTGAGKTRVAVETLHRWAHDMLDEGGVAQIAIAWLAHTEELCEQAVECFEDVWRSNPKGRLPLRVARYWGDFRHDVDQPEGLDELLVDAPIVAIVSTPQSFVTAEPGIAALHQRATINGIVIDEAHRAAAPTYRTLIERHGGSAAIIGLTATPFRREFDIKQPLAGTKELQRLFRHLILPDMLGAEPLDRLVKLQEMGVLARPEFRTVETRLTLNVDEFDADTDDNRAVINIDQDLGRAADQTRRRRVAIGAIMDILDTTSSARVLYFGPSVNDAELVAFLLRSKGKRAAAVSGTTKATTRRSIIADFKSGRLDILCNCEVLTTGFDAPQVSHVIMARPTISQVLYEQMVGRGLRGPRFGGTPSCVIVDFEDRFRGARPQLGWQKFRDVWRPSRSPDATPATEEIGLLIQLGRADAIRVPKNTAGIARRRYRNKAERELSIPVRITLEGEGTGTLTISTLLLDHPESVETTRIELSPARRREQTLLHVPAQYELRLEARTGERGAHIEIRRDELSTRR